MPNLYPLPLTIVARTTAGAVIPNAQVKFKKVSDGTAATVYQDPGLTTAHPDPVVADASGLLPPIYMNPAIPLKAIFNDQSGNLVRPVDLFGPGSVQLNNLTLSVASRAAQAALPVEAGQSVLVEDFSGGMFRTVTDSQLSTQETAEKSADPDGGVYRPSAAAGGIVHVRGGVDREGIIRPAYWDIKGDGRDVADVSEAMQAMLDFGFASGHAIHLNAGAVYETKKALLMKGGTLIGNGAKLINTSTAPDGADVGSLWERTALAIGLSHPAHDSAVNLLPKYELATVVKGQQKLFFNNSTEAANFPVGSLLVIASNETVDYKGENEKLRYRLFKQVVRVVRIAGSSITIDRPVAESLVTPWALNYNSGYLDSYTDLPVCIADRPYVRGLHVESKYLSPIMRVAIFEGDIELLSLRGLAGAGGNMLCYTKYRVGHVGGRERVLEIASGSHNFDVEIADGAFSVNEPLPDVNHDATEHRAHVKVGEGSRDGVIRIGNLDENASYSEGGFLELNFCKRIRVEFGNVALQNLRRNLVTVKNTAVEPEDTLGTQFPTEDITLAFGTVTYGPYAGAVGSALISVDNEGGQCRRVGIERGRFISTGAAPLAPAAYFEGTGHWTGPDLFMSGALRLGVAATQTGTAPSIGSFQGYFTRGLASDSNLNADIRIQSDAGAAMRKQQGSDTALGVGTANLLSVPVAAGGMIVGDAIEFDVQYEATGSGAKSITLSGGATQLANIALPAGAASGTVSVLASLAADDRFHVSASLNGEVVAGGGLRTGFNLSGTAAKTISGSPGTHLTITSTAANNNKITVNGHQLTLVASKVRVGETNLETAELIAEYINANSVAFGVTASVPPEGQPLRDIVTLTANTNGASSIGTSVTGLFAEFENPTLTGGTSTAPATGKLTVHDLGKDGNTITINAITFALAHPVSLLERNQVMIGLDARDTASNIMSYINSKAGVLRVVAGISPTDPRLSLTAIEPGVAGNSIAWSAIGTAVTPTSGTLSGGADGGVTFALTATVANSGDTLSARFVSARPRKIGHA